MCRILAERVIFSPNCSRVQPAIKLVEARGVEQFQVFSSEIKAICLQKISE